MTREEEIENYLQKIGKGKFNAFAFDLGFESGVKWADKHPHWISVEDELPPIGRSMIVLISYGGDVQLGEWDDGLFHEIKLGAIIHPTHWMPLPSIEHLKDK